MPLNVADLAMLKRAGSWGLLCWQSNRPFYLAGLFSLPISDMYRLIEAAGGRVLTDSTLVPVLPAGTLVVIGPRAEPVLRYAADTQQLEVTDEAGLVRLLTPSVGMLLFGLSNEAPF